jgi:WD40 repeat protein
MTPDGQHVRFSVGAGRSILDLTVDPEDGLVWGADFDFDEIISYDPATDSSSVTEVAGVNTVSYDPSSRTLWAGSFFQGSVRSLTRSGTLLETHEGVGFVEDLDVVPGEGVYVASRSQEGTGTIFWIDTAGSEAEAVLGVTWPVAVQYDPVQDGVWIMDRGATAVLFLPRGAREAEEVHRGLDTGVDLSIDGEGRCWAADRGGRILRLVRGEGADRDIGLDIAPEGITVDPVRGELWVAAPREGSVRVLDFDGGERFSWQGNLWPKKAEGAWDPVRGWRCGSGRVGG